MLSMGTTRAPKSRRTSLPFGVDLACLIYESVRENNADKLQKLVDMRDLELVKGRIMNWRNPDQDGCTALHLAAACGRVDIIKCLLENGADIHLKNYYGSTPLHSAAAQGKMYACRCLCSAGASTHVINDAGHTPLHLAAINGHESIVTWLV